MSTYKKAIMNAIQQNIKLARSHLAIGWHNPEVMEKIEILYRALYQVNKFEQKLLMDNMDID
ncbi:hypothetical protein AR679_gp238 [Yellowstone lake phycodnavirus 1]|uniref:hypothetical protein n=1 Tax=Yellowstone lake phycodnavirus 1 TaxID=1586713 RepID=UPI0006EB8F08|nr:hypothetical protein AR679_gp238 [Yellowstone lake phycodnavirus 1]BAT22264.1 hypothetical protein [Yellowstone lake phycodnavirus 1]